MQVLLQKTHRRSKPIKKQEKIINHNLKRKKIFLDKENFDIVGVLEVALRTQQIRQDQPEKRPDSAMDIEFSQGNMMVPPMISNPNRHDNSCENNTFAFPEAKVPTGSVVPSMGRVRSHSEQDSPQRPSSSATLIPSLPSYTANTISELDKEGITEIGKSKKRVPPKPKTKKR